jgi:hypothetical protein
VGLLDGPFDADMYALLTMHSIKCSIWLRFVLAAVHTSIPSSEPLEDLNWVRTEDCSEGSNEPDPDHLLRHAMTSVTRCH